MTGGGSGGHITPILAIASELKRQYPAVTIYYLGQRGDALADVPAADPNIDQVYTVSAGKLRRYADETWLQRLLDVRTIALNLRDVARILAGVWQSWRLLGKLQPDVIFTRGGFVSVPVAFGGRFRHIPYITHDSDSVPSLANRLIASGAIKHAVALPPEVYPYPTAKTVMVGVPVSNHYQPVTSTLQAQYRKEIDLKTDQMVFVTGGGNGARVLNQAVADNARYLLGTFPDLTIVHVAGRSLENETNEAYDALGLGKARERVQVHGFLTDLHRYSGAADIIIARGGATNLAEFALQRKACLIVPSKQLSWNVQNAATLAERKAIIQLTEDQIEQPERLGRAIGDLLDHPLKRTELGNALAEYAHPNAAAELAVLILETGEKEGHAGPKT